MKNKWLHLGDISLLVAHFDNEGFYILVSSFYPTGADKQKNLA